MENCPTADVGWRGKIEGNQNGSSVPLPEPEVGATLEKMNLEVMY